jgi:MFS family permease
MALGASISTIVTGIIRKKYGTKLTVVIVGIPTTFGWLLMIFAKNSAMVNSLFIQAELLIFFNLNVKLQLMIGRFLSGFAAGAYGILLPLYVGEISSKEIRGTLLTFHQIVLNFGEIFVFTFGFLTSYTTLNIVCSMIPVIYCILFYTLLPESPVYLV